MVGEVGQEVVGRRKATILPRHHVTFIIYDQEIINIDGEVSSSSFYIMEGMMIDNRWQVMRR